MGYLGLRHRVEGEARKLLILKGIWISPFGGRIRPFGGCSLYF
jgi:hypothetical protein